ncbi:hypothetical protein NL676_009385 [Syzygium grande]|nr:hypothetical protein NL676_009385 [Syzygium grande]
MSNCSKFLSMLLAHGLGLVIGTLMMGQQLIRYLSISHYTYKLLMGSQFKPEDAYPCGESSCLVRDCPGIKKAGLDGHVVSEIALEIKFVWYRVIAYIVLMRIGMTKRRKLQALFFSRLDRAVHRPCDPSSISSSTTASDDDAQLTSVP